MRELRPNSISSFFPDRWQATEKPWRLWRTWRDVRSIAGEFSTRPEAEKAMVQIARLPGETTIEYTGKSLGGEDKPMRGER